MPVNSGITQLRFVHDPVKKKTLSKLLAPNPKSLVWPPKQPSNWQSDSPSSLLPLTLYLPGVFNTSHKNAPINSSTSAPIMLPQPLLTAPYSLLLRPDFCLGPRPSSTFPRSLPHPPNLSVILLPLSGKNDIYHLYNLLGTLHLLPYYLSFGVHNRSLQVICTPLCISITWHHGLSFP